jgi:CubicO group peptidase (beta-lactamase class C family)
MSSEALGRLDHVLEGYVDRGQLPGYQLLVARHGQVIHESVYGQMDIENQRILRPDTIYRIYSMSKVITGVATMIAYEQGGFLLTDPISKYLPALADMSVMEWDDNGDTRIVPAEREITILDLLRHTSGFSYHFIAPSPLGQQYTDASITPGVRPLPVTTSLGNAGPDQEATLQDMVERLGQLPLVIQPGSAWHYGINMDVLGRLIEVSSGQSFPDFLEEHVFGPLEMSDTSFYVPDEKIERFATCYGATPEAGLKMVDPAFTSAYRQPPAMPGGGAGLVSTASDYMRFALMLTNGGSLDGKRLLSPRTARLMMSNHLSRADFGDRPLRSIAGNTYANGGLGLGFGLSGSVITDPAFTGLPVSEGTFGWGGAASTFFWSDPQKEISVVFMTQLLPSNTYTLRADLMRGVNAALLD